MPTYPSCHGDGYDQVVLDRLKQLSDRLVGSRLGLADFLAVVPDPRDERGRVYALSALLTTALAAKMAGNRGFKEIAEWVADNPVDQRLEMGLPAHRCPDEGTYRYSFSLLNPDLIDRFFSLWVRQQLIEKVEGHEILAVDGKAQRGARCDDHDAPYLLAAYEHNHQVVCGQIRVGEKTNEISCLTELLGLFPLKGVVVTLDALHTQHAHADWLIAQQAHYMFCVKKNQPSLYEKISKLPWRNVPTADYRNEKSHGRGEIRTLKAVTLQENNDLGFTGATQVIRVTRRRTIKKKGVKKTSKETMFYLTTLTPAEMSGEGLAAVIRGHWGIENKLHWVRDVTFKEDHHQVKNLNLAQVLAILTNLILNIFRLQKVTNIAETLRYHGRVFKRPWHLIQNS